MPPSKNTFDPLAQNVTMLKGDGITPVTTSMTVIDTWNKYNVRCSILFGAQLGALLIMFVLTAVLTKPTKRRTPVYILNLCSLFFGFLRALLLCAYFDGAWTELYTYVSGDYTTIPTSAYATSIATDVIYTLFAAAATSSLVLQAHTVTKAIARKWQILLTGLSVLVLLLSFGTRLASTTMNSLAILHAQNFYDYTWLLIFARVMECVSIWWFSIIFTSKLVYTLVTRRNMGLRAWSYLQILVAMGTCTMIIPSIFAILDWPNLKGFPEEGTLPLCLVALLLPLSSLWASMITTEADATFNVAKLWDSGHSLSCPDCGKCLSSTSTVVDSKTSYTDRKGSIPTTTSSRIATRITGNDRRDSTEQDLLSMGVRVQRSYSIHSEKDVQLLSV